MENVIKEHQDWLNDVYEKMIKKVERTAISTGDSCFPLTTKNGKFVNDRNGSDEVPHWWTNGFWVGIMWLMYAETKIEHFRNVAESLEDKLDAVIEDFEYLIHDVGFMWLPSSVANYRLTGNEKSKKRGLHVATILAGRFNPSGNFIRAWNDRNNAGSKGWAIIDCMMNIPLLYWATQETGDPRFKHIAMKHADMTAEHFIRRDGSVKHIVEFDPDTGEYIKNYTGQGYSEESSWTRGQAWAIYGFILSYIHTGKQEYLDVAKRVAHYFIANLQDDYVPPCDFRSPKVPEYKDTTAGVITACGLIEIAKAVPEFEKELYFDAAIKILKATEKRYCDWSDTEDSIVQMGTGAYHNGKDKNVPIIYGDYYFIEAILKLRGSDLLFW